MIATAMIVGRQTMASVLIIDLRAARIDGIPAGMRETTIGTTDITLAIIADTSTLTGTADIAPTAIPIVTVSTADGTVTDICHSAISTRTPARSVFVFPSTGGEIQRRRLHQASGSAGPACLTLAGAGTEIDVQNWVSRREPRAIYLNAQYRFFPHGTETRLEVRVTVSGVDKKWMPGLEKMIDDFLQTRLAPYVEGIHGKTTVAAVDFPGT